MAEQDLKQPQEREHQEPTTTPANAELSDEQLENVAGGADSQHEYYKVTFKEILISG